LSSFSEQIMKFLMLGFIPASTNPALLLLRVALSLQMLVAHGWGKLSAFSDLKAKFPDPLGVGSSTSLALAVAGEVLCPCLLVLGLFSRLAAVGATITMAVAFFAVHRGKLIGDGNGELAFLYLIGFMVLVLAGPGRFAMDSGIGSGAQKAAGTNS